ncbi:hypothetical protein B0H19DRAFT_1235166 [Mycena capillaripes]|nr:hypothetical protein B0H19DRAFT_1235166 [Mycena capillaripes]
MTGVQELRVRIERLSTEINLQRDVTILKQLEQDKIIVQRQLNAVLDPVARLPIEISSDIFLRSFRLSSQRPAPKIFPCYIWTNIALSTPALWAAIHITFPRAEAFKNVLTVWLQRANNHPLSISLRGPLTFDRGIMDIIWRHGHQLEHLEICYDEAEDEDSEEDSERIEFLGDETPGPLPLLKKIPRPPHFGAAPLVECLFQEIPMYSVDEPTETLVLPTLRRLMFGEWATLSQNDDEILKYLSLPSLEIFSLSLCDLSYNDLFSFLKRSSPPLQELAIAEGQDPGRLCECLRLVPTLTHFEIWRPGPLLLEELFAALAESSSPMLPNLRNLTIQPELSSLTILHSSWKTLLRALTGRRGTKLQIVHIEMKATPSVSLKPAAEILAALEDQVKDGMQIYIGTGNFNFLSV